jgi:predicted  nucleic acid-binding Zn-ribbon protein
MEAVLVFMVLAGLVWSIWKLGEPWRKYHAQHIVPLERKIASIEARRAENEHDRMQAITNAELLMRDFRREVRQHQEAKNKAFDEINPMRDRKSKLHDAMNDVQASLNSWHRKSKSVFGNKRQKIKNNSILGSFGLEQTMAQKESLESRRASISSEIRDLKRKMTDIYDERVKPAKEGIKAAFDDEKRVKRLRQDGWNERLFRIKAKDLELEIAKLDGEIVCLKAAISDVTKAYKKQRRA